MVANGKNNDVVLYKGRTTTVVRASLTWPDGSSRERDVIRHPGAAVIVPYAPDGKLLLVRQYRSAIGQFMVEFPAGTLDAGETPLECAQREIQEETGFAARTWTALGQMYPVPGYCDELLHLFLAKDLFPSVLPKDEDELIEELRWSSSELLQAVKKDLILDAKTLGAILLLQQKGYLAQ